MAMSPSVLDSPLWRNCYLTVGALRQPLEQASSLARHFRDLGYTRLRDFLDRHGSMPSIGLCKDILASVEFASPRLRSLAASHFIQQLSTWNLIATPILYGPSAPVGIIAALHGWSFRNKAFIILRNQDIYRLMHQLPSLPVMLNDALDITVAPNWSTVWRTDLSLDKTVLPVLSDLKFRLQHNALGLRKKHTYHTTEVMCPHGCPIVESAKHLFWECPIASQTWTTVLRPLQPLLESQLQWKGIAYLLDLSFSDSAWQTQHCADIECTASFDAISPMASSK